MCISNYTLAQQIINVVISYIKRVNIKNSRQHITLELNWILQFLLETKGLKNHNKNKNNHSTMYPSILRVIFLLIQNISQLFLFEKHTLYTT